ncbi:ROK family protein [Inquilinus sp. KBS0705]|nr:ROK family protein [Inquilinus sp. KBS0705]
MPLHKNIYLYGNLIKHYIIHGALSIGELSDHTKRSVPSVTKIVNELVANGILKDDGLGISNGGRRPATFSIVNGMVYILSVAANQFTTRVAIIDISNHDIVYEKEFKLNLYDYEPSAEKLAGIIKTCLANPIVNADDFLAVEVTMPGFVDTKLGTNNSFLPPPQGTLVEYLTAETGLPIFIDNDSTAIALAEQMFGDKSALKNSMVVNLGWGVGLGMIMNGQIFRGHSGYAGEFSHLALFKNGKICSCGKYGCLETEASLLAIEDKARAGVASGHATSLSKYNEFSADDIIAEALRGDAFCIKIISEAAYNVGQGLAILIHLMNPESIILSGKGSVLGKLWLAPIQQAINEHCIPKLTTYVNLLVSGLGNNAQLYGGLILIAENLQNINPRVNTNKHLVNAGLGYI